MSSEDESEGESAARVSEMAERREWIAQWICCPFGESGLCNR